MRDSALMTPAATTPAATTPAADAPVSGARVAIVELCSAQQTEEAAELLRQVWRSEEPPVPANLLRAVQRAGGYVHGAVDERGRLVAASMAFVSLSEEGPGLHSHITGVAPAGQRRGLGLALKQHQRRWAIDHDLPTITWTCDPLVRRNVAFNLHALGARVEAYLPDHYGTMTDGVNAGDASDRLELRWELLSDRAVRAAQSRLAPVDAAGLPVLVSEESGRPRVVGSGARGTVQLPEDIEALRSADPAGARAWRTAVREAVQPALAAGSVVTGLTAAGAIVLEEPA